MIAGPMHRTDMPVEDVAELLMYDPISGRFTWKVRRGSTLENSKAGTVNRGILYIALKRKQYKAAEIASYLMTGVWQWMEHIDGDKLNLSWENLRPVAESHDTEKLYLQCFQRDGGWHIVSNLPSSFIEKLQIKLAEF